MGQPISSYVEERHELGEPGLPATPPSGVMWLFTEIGQPDPLDAKIVAVEFLCPCGCGSSCYTPLEGPHPHCWSYSPGPTLTPSIRFLGGCKAHFNITNGKTVIHADSGR